MFQIIKANLNASPLKQHAMYLEMCGTEAFIFNVIQAFMFFLICFKFRLLLL